MKNFKEMAEALLAGKTLVDKQGREYFIRTDDGELIVKTIDGALSVYAYSLIFSNVEIKSKYADLKMDDPVYVWNNGGKKMKRYFAGIDEHGLPLTWNDGATSWSANPECTMSWDHCEPANK